LGNRENDEIFLFLVKKSSLKAPFQKNILEVRILGHMFGIHLPSHGLYSFDSLLEAALSAEKYDIDSFWIGDHFFLPADLYEKFGGDPKRPDKLDAWTTLAAIASRTKKIRLGTRVSPIPFYLPGRLAKIVATVDIISKGRVQLGVGAGWYEEEAVSYGIPWESLRERIERTVEGLQIIKKLWTSEWTSYEGKYYRLKNAPFFPKPLQHPYPPIFFGGKSRGILRAVANFGNGWLPSTDTSLEEFKDAVTEIKKCAKDLGRDPSTIVMSPALTMNPKDTRNFIEKVGKFLENGAQQIILDVFLSGISPEEAPDAIMIFAEEVASHFKS
jgi:alkanesulfonate monooxygenase SsuD/methylene tetrahydromethanopterin reductase-like flavin-dependent oxidoreductase (luciferase family)